MTQPHAVPADGREVVPPYNPGEAPAEPDAVGKLRAEAAVLRGKSGDAAARKARLARSLKDLAGGALKAAELELGVLDCQNRRYRLWAEQLEEAAREIEEP